MDKIKEGYETQYCCDAKTVAGIPLNKEQLALFEKIDTQARGVDFGLGKHTPDQGTPTTVLTSVAGETPEETITEALTNTELLQSVSIYSRFTELKQHIKNFENAIGDDYEVVISASNINKFTEMNLVSVTVYKSGALSARCEAMDGKQASLFDHIDKISFALTKSAKIGPKKKCRKVEFNFSTDD